jgi:hypothetical protein
MNDFWSSGLGEDKSAETAVAPTQQTEVQPAEVAFLPEAQNVAPVLTNDNQQDPEKRIIDELKKEGLIVEGSVGTAISALSNDEKAMIANNREAAGDIANAINDIYSMTDLKELQSAATKYPSVPQSIIKAAIQERHEQIAVNDALALALFGGTAVGNTLTPENSPLLFGAPLPTNIQPDNQPISRVSNDVTVPTTEKSTAEKKDGIGKLIEMLITLVTGGSFANLFGVKSEEQQNANVPDTSVSNPVVGQGTQAAAKIEQKNVESQPIKFNPALNAAIGDNILQFSSATVGADNLFSLSPMQTPNMAPITNNVAVNQTMGRTK